MAFIKPIHAPNILPGIPKKNISDSILSTIPVILEMIFNIIIKSTNITTNAIAS